MIELLLGLVFGFMISAIMMATSKNVAFVYEQDGKMFATANGKVYEMIELEGGEDEA